MCFSLFHAVRMLGLLATVPSVNAKACKSNECTLLSDDPAFDTSGLSLMQSGGSILPVISKQGIDFALSDGLVDEFAELEDEFDNGYVQAHAASRVQIASESGGAPAQSHFVSPIFDHVFNPYLYVETLLVIATLALVTRICKWVFSKNPTTLQTPGPLPEATAAALSAACEPSLVKQNFAALEEAVRSGDEAACIEALKQGGRWAVRQEDPYGCTALHIAAHCGSAKMVRLLLKHGAKVDACEAWDETPLHFAARFGSVEVCCILLDHGAGLDAANAYGWTPLLAAGHADQEAACELLLSKGAGAGGVDDTDLPPLVNTLLVRRIFSESVRPAEEPNPEGDENNTDVSEDSD